jgi:hypothetical protein
MEEQRRYFGYSSEKWMKMTAKQQKQAAEDYAQDRKNKRFGQTWGIMSVREVKA